MATDQTLGTPPGATVPKSESATMTLGELEVNPMLDNEAQVIAQDSGTSIVGHKYRMSPNAVTEMVGLLQDINM